EFIFSKMVFPEPFEPIVATFYPWRIPKVRSLKVTFRKMIASFSRIFKRRMSGEFYHS
ncbi:MAG: hypothetical protein ACI97P_001737, partial [Arcticibacterium sp.]